MKKFLLILAVLLYSLSLSGQEPKVVIELTGGETKTYNIEEIKNISIIKTLNNFVMKIYHQGIVVESYFTKNIDSLKFVTINDFYENMIVYFNKSEYTYKLYEIDEIVFSIVQSPKITGVTPTTSKIGDIITINGSNFGSIQGTSTVNFTNAVASEYIKWTDTQIQVKVPKGAKSGFISVTVNTYKSNEVNINVRTPPVIESINPTSFAVGGIVTIYGSDFGSSRGSSFVEFNNISAINYSSWNDTEIQVEVPTGAITGKISVTVNALKSNEVNYTIVIAPKITAIDPVSANEGDVIKIIGNYFGATQGSSKVTFNTTDATEYTYWSNLQIECKVPTGVKTGNLTVTVNNLKSNAFPYRIKLPIEVVLIPSGSFQMGNTGSMADGMQPETPVHQVTISNSFYMTKYEVQQSLWVLVMGSNPSNFKGNDLPVDRVSWYMALDFCNKLSELDGLEKCYSEGGSCNWSANGWRLPTEAEWEYACKAGSKSNYYNGNNEANLAAAGWYSGNSSESHSSGQKVPNSFGLYDMLGNQSELCWDWVGTYSSNSETDPKGPSSGKWKIARGGSWHQPASMCRSSMRGWMDSPDMQSSACGFRIVRRAD